MNQKLQKIKVNKIQCKLCGDIIESKSVHDFRSCKCGECSCDGGHEYLKRGAMQSWENVIELSEMEDV